MSKPHFRIGKQGYTFRELTIQDYYELQVLALTNDNESGFDIISRLSGCPIKLLKSVYHEEWLDIWLTAQKVIYNSIHFPVKEATRIIELDGVKYGLINLDKISVGEFGDLDVILSSENAENRMHEAMAVLYRPVKWSLGSKYKVEDYDTDDFQERAEAFRRFPLSQAKLNIAFFLNSASTSLKATTDYLITQLEIAGMEKEKTAELKEIFTKLLDHGIPQLINSQTKTHSESTKPQSSIFEPLLTGWRGRSTSIRESKKLLENAIKLTKDN